MIPIIGPFLIVPFLCLKKLTLLLMYNAEPPISLQLLAVASAHANCKTSKLYQRRHLFSALNG